MDRKSGSLSDNARNQRSQFGIASHTRWLALAAVAVLAFSGCSEKRVPVFPVSGKVNFQGKPAVGAVVVLNPVDSSANHDVMPTGTVNSDGSFTLTAYEDGDGAPQGDYVATIQWFKVLKEGPGPNVLPKSYANPKNSPIKVTVGNGPVEIPAITIK